MDNLGVNIVVHTHADYAFLLLPETSEANILFRRVKRLRKATGDYRLRSKSEVDSAHHTIRDHLIIPGRAFTLTFSEPIFSYLSLYSLTVRYTLSLV